MPIQCPHQSRQRRDTQGVALASSSFQPSAGAADCVPDKENMSAIEEGARHTQNLACDTMHLRM